MKKEKNPNDKKIFVVAVVLAFVTVLAAVGLTIAFFTGGIVGNDDATETVIETGELRLLLTDGEVIAVDNALPGQTVSKTFTVENLGTARTTFSIILNDMINTFQNNELVMSMTCRRLNASAIEDGTCEGLEETAIIYSETIIDEIIKDNIEIEPEYTHEYTLTVTFKEIGSAQDYNQGALFTGKVNIASEANSYQISGTLLYSNSTPVTDAIVEIQPEAVSDETNESGEFTVEGVQAGSHTLKVTDKTDGSIIAEDTFTLSPGETTQVTNNKDIQIAENESSVNLNLSINDSGTLDAIEIKPSAVDLKTAMLRDNVAQSDEAIDFGVGNDESGTNGLYYTSDASDTEGGERVYYYRGAVENNSVIFAGICWRIIRTNEDGSVRIMYYGTPDSNGYCPANGNQTAPITSQTFSYNAQYGQNANLGFMYGTPGSSTYAAEHANINNSNIKTQLESWYQNNISEEYRSKIANAVYCNDRSIGTGGTLSGFTYTELGYGANNTLYGATRRLATSGPTGTTMTSANANPTFVCPQENDKFTLSVVSGGTDGYGNNALTYPVGLLTADEVSYAGGAYGRANLEYYLNSITENWWTMTPLIGPDTVFFVQANAYMTSKPVDRNAGSAFPVVSLISDVIVTEGDGTTTDPYIVE